MSAASLESWLLDEGIREELDLLTQLTVRGELDSLIPEDPSTLLHQIEWSRLLFAGSILARSRQHLQRDAALRIATAAMTISSSDQVKEAAAVLLGKLSNFRAVELAVDRDLVKADFESRLGVSSRMEAQRRHLDQAVMVESTGKLLQVNDFQRRFWTAARDNDWLSASAPTASGKTFLVLQWLLDQMRSTEARVAVYLAPTRALVSEIEDTLRKLVGGDQGVAVSSLPLREKYDFARQGGQKLILVFTQERLHLLANVISAALAIELLIVDEAHKIGDKKRGVILQDAVERVTRGSPGSKVVFLSPATQNPEALLIEAPDSVSAMPLDSDIPTVLQNLMVAQQVPRKPKQWTISVRQSERLLPVGVLQLANSPSSAGKRLAFISAAIGKRGGTLVYANGAAESEKIADLIYQLTSTDASIDTELQELADLARRTVHSKFKLAGLVEQGVAFHYGNMPSLIRLEVERLFRSGKIKFLVCTSTLIEGVNLSCRTIVVRGPRKGMGHPMEPHDFWNLAGRAGRWGNEFQGNIICVDPNDKAAWPHGIPPRARYLIKRETDAVMEKGDALVTYLESYISGSLSDGEHAEEFDNVAAYLLSTFLRLGSITNTSIAVRHDAETVGRIEQILSAVAGTIQIGADIATRHPGVSAFGLQRLLQSFRNYEGDVDNLIPAPADSDDSYDRFVAIMERINRHLFPAFLPDALIPLHARTVVQWLKGFSLAFMIRKNIEYQVKRGREVKIANIIRQTMELVEQTARFRAPKYFAAYVDVLNFHLREIGREDLIDDEINIGTQLEFGVSSQTLLSLLQLGLSRTSAVALYEVIARDDLTQQGCIDWLEKRNARISELDLPAAIVREIQAKIIPGTGRRTS